MLYEVITEYTASGRLVGHIVLGRDLLRDCLREVEAPLYEPGTMPALSLYTTINDLGRFSYNFV